MATILDSPQYDSARTLNDSLDVITRFVGILSILGCIFNIVVTKHLKKTKSVIGRMVIILAVFDLLNSIPAVLTTIGPATNRFMCEIAGCWLTYFGFASSYFFTTCFAHSLYHSLETVSIEFAERNYKRYIALSLVAGLLVGTASVGIGFKQYISDPNGSMCSTPQFPGLHLGVLFTLIFPGIINLVGCITYYLLTIRVLKSLNQKKSWGLLVYPLILVLCISPALIQRFLFLIGDENVPAIYTQITRALFGAQGFLNSLAYGLSKEVYEALRKRCCDQRRGSETLKLSLVYEPSNSKDRLFTL